MAKYVLFLISIFGLACGLTSGVRAFAVSKGIHYPSIDQIANIQAVLDIPNDSQSGVPEEHTESSPADEEESFQSDQENAFDEASSNHLLALSVAVVDNLYPSPGISAFAQPHLPSPFRPPCV